jgi:hypothetical protein
VGYSVQRTLPEGVMKIQSYRWQREAKLDEAIFEEYIADTKSKGQELTTAGLLHLENVLRQQARLHAIISVLDEHGA